jgi:hypothetical protein
MRKHSIRFLAGRTLLVAGAAVASWLTSNPVRAVQLTLEPPAQTVGTGAMVEITVKISGLGNATAPSVGAYDLTVSFDPLILSYNSASLGTYLAPFAGSVSGPPVVDAINGSVNLFEVSLDSPADLDSTQPDQFTLASVWFSAIAVGSSGLDFSSVLLGDGKGDLLPADAVGALISVVPNGNAIPEASPRTAAFLVCALSLGQAALRRRKRCSRHGPE